jgi:hypothetical protein
MSNQFKISVPVIVTKRTKFWVAYCPILKTYGYSSKGKDAALKDFDDAIKTFFYVQDTLGTLNKTLLNLGWVRKERNLTIPRIHSNLSPFRGKNSTSRKIQLPAAYC